MPWYLVVHASRLQRLQAARCFTAHVAPIYVQPPIHAELFTEAFTSLYYAPAAYNERRPWYGSINAVLYYYLRT